jgi:hypothetical protein
MRPDEFIRRFLLHVLPKGFRKIRHYGLLAPANVGTRLRVACRLLDQAGHPHDTRRFEPAEILGVPPSKLRCPACGGDRIEQRPLPEARGPPEST